MTLIALAFAIVSVPLTSYALWLAWHDRTAI